MKSYLRQNRVVCIVKFGVDIVELVKRHQKHGHDGIYNSSEINVGVIAIVGSEDDKESCKSDLLMRGRCWNPSHLLQSRSRISYK